MCKHPEVRTRKTTLNYLVYSELERKWNFARLVGVCCCLSCLIPNTLPDFCSTCPYVCQIEKRVKIKRQMRLVKKTIDPIFSENDQQNLPTTDTTCPACNHGKAAFYLVQIRSADEPMTTFYICKRETCRKQWRED